MKKEKVKNNPKQQTVTIKTENKVFHMKLIHHTAKKMQKTMTMKK